MISSLHRELIVATTQKTSVLLPQYPLLINLRVHLLSPEARWEALEGLGPLGTGVGRVDEIVDRVIAGIAAAVEGDVRLEKN
jgi:hypothetical protein